MFLFTPSEPATTIHNSSQYLALMQLISKIISQNISLSVSCIALFREKYQEGIHVHSSLLVTIVMLLHSNDTREKEEMKKRQTPSRNLPQVSSGQG